MSTATKRALELKRADLADARLWVEDLRGLNPSPLDVFCATNYVTLVQDDIKRLEQQLLQEHKS